MSDINTTIEGVRFTDTELLIMACFTDSDSGKPSTIAKILNKSVKTVYSHLYNIKAKINAPTIDGISLFLRQSDQFMWLKSNFVSLYIEYYFREVSKKVAAQLRAKNITCNLIVTGDIYDQKTTENIARSIESLGIKTNTERTSFIKKSDVKSDQLSVYLYKDNKSIEQLNAKNVLYICIDDLGLSAQDSQFKYHTFYHPHKKDDYYRTLIKFIVNQYPAIAELDAVEDFIVKAENIDINLSALAPELSSDHSNRIRYKTDKLLSSLKKRIAYKTHIVIASILLLMTLIVVSFHSALMGKKSTVSTHQPDKAWHLPKLVDHHITRTALMDKLWEKLQADQSNGPSNKASTIAGLYGLGGVGKTTIAASAIRHPRGDYQFKAWFTAETEDLLRADYLKLGNALRLFSETSPEQKKIHLVKSWLENKRDTLLVYDNAPGMDFLSDYLPNSGKIIVTSRNYKIPGAIEVNVMTSEEASEMLNHLLNSSKKTHSQKEKNQLIEMLGYLPLAIAQAGSYISENVISIPDYIMLYETEKKYLLSKNTMPIGDVHQPVYITWNISLEKIRKQPRGPQALKLLDVVGYCYPEHIPKRLLIQYLFGENSNQGKIELNEVLQLLRQYSFVKVDLHSISLHRLVHEWSRNSHDNLKKKSILKKSISALESIYPSNNKEKDDIAFVKILLPHLESILLYYTYFNDERGNISLLAMLGDAQYVLGNYKRSMKYLERNLELIRAKFDADSIEIADAQLLLGRTYAYNAVYAQSEELMLLSLKAYENYYGQYHIKLINTLLELGSLYHILSQPTKAKMHLKRAQVIIEKKLGPNHKDNALVLSRLGWVELHLSNYNSAKNIFLKSLSILNKHYDEDQVATANSLRGLAWSEIVLGNYESADKLLKNAYQNYQNYYGFDHVRIAYTLHALGGLNMEQGKYLKAREQLEKAHMIKKSIHNDNDIVFSYILMSLGESYTKLNQYEEAEKLLKQSLTIKNSVYKSENAILARNLRDIGILYSHMGKYEQAKDALKKCLDILGKRIKTEQLEVAMTQSALSWLAIKTNHPLEALDYANKAHAVFMSTNNKPDAKAASTLTNIGIAQLMRGEHIESEQALQGVLKMLKERFGSDSIFYAKALVNLGNFYRIIDNKSLSQRLLSQAQSILNASFAYDQIAIAAVAENLELLSLQQEKKIDVNKNNLGVFLEIIG